MDMRGPLGDSFAMPRSGFDRASKRSFDVVLATLLSLLFAPVLLTCAVAVRLALGSPVLFRQSRPGLDGRLFTLLKFRTMRIAVGPDGRPLSDAERLNSRLGRFLRKSSLDELPSLWNVLRGEMSFVGPRPLMPQYLDRYTPHQARRHEVRPGITGWAQVNGRNLIDWETRFDMDVWYVDHANFWLDLKILLMTFVPVLRATGVSPQGEATMPEFMGTRSPPPSS